MLTALGGDCSRLSFVWAGGKVSLSCGSSGSRRAEKRFSVGKLIRSGPDDFCSSKDVSCTMLAFAGFSHV